MATVYLIRHAEPAVRGVFLGQMDPPLTDAARPAFALDVRIVYTSPLRRAMQTAAAIECDRVEVLPELRELGYGEWTGKTWEEIEERWPDLAREKLRNWTGVTPPGGESWTDFAERVARAWARIREGPFPAAVVAHQAVNAALVAPENPESFAQKYAEVITHEC